MKWVLIGFILLVPLDAFADIEWTGRLVIDPTGDDRKVTVVWELEKPKVPEDHPDYPLAVPIVFQFLDSNRRVEYRSEASPIPWWFAVGVQKFGKREAVIFRGTRGVQNGGVTLLFYETATQKIKTIDLCEGRDCGYGNPEPIGPDFFRIDVTEASGILPGVMGSGPPIYSAFTVRFLEGRVEIKEHAAPADPKAKREGFSDWCRWFYEEQKNTFEDYREQVKQLGPDYETRFLKLYQITRVCEGR